MSKKEKVLLGMSGGVDSCVSALLLKNQGYDVIGITMKLWDEEREDSCCNESSVYDAKRVCDMINIPHYSVNYKAEFKDNVIDDFVSSYIAGRTPNPCIECNKYLKFGKMFEMAKKLECKYIATGHYAKIEYSNKYNRYVIKKSNSIKKDQSYVLYSINKEVLPYIIFPLGDYEDKSMIRKIASDNNFKVASKSDSQDICFIPDNDYIKFLSSYANIKSKTGNIVLKNGEKVGIHNGYIRYTIGQRRGIGVSYKEPLYVTSINKEKNEVVVGPESDIFSNVLYANNINLQAIDSIEGSLRVKAKIRYSAKESSATISMVDNDKIKVVFDEKQRAITPGQSIVFYDDDIIIGGGKII